MKITYYNGQQYAATSDLKPFDHYGKKEIEGQNLKALKNSIQCFGVKKPLVVNTYPGREGTIIDGVQVHKIAQELGISEVPCFFVEYPKDLEEALHYVFSIQTHEYSIETIIAKFDSEYACYFDTQLGEHAEIFKAGSEALKKGRKQGLQRVKPFSLRLDSEYRDYPEKLRAMLEAESQNQAIQKLIVAFVEGRIKL